MSVHTSITTLPTTSTASTTTATSATSASTASTATHLTHFNLGDESVAIGVQAVKHATHPRGELILGEFSITIGIVELEHLLHSSGHRPPTVPVATPAASASRNPPAVRIGLEYELV